MAPRRSARILAKKAASNQEAASAAVQPQPATSRRIITRRATTNTTASRQRTGFRARPLNITASRRGANMTANQRAGTYRHESHFFEVTTPREIRYSIIVDPAGGVRRLVTHQLTPESQTVLFRSGEDGFEIIANLSDGVQFPYPVPRVQADAPTNATRVAEAPANPLRTNIGYRRLHSEMAKMTSEPTDGCQVEILGDSIYNWRAFILGPAGTPYEGGQFELHIRFPNLYPSQPPSLQFRTKIYHCNINHGFVCIDILGSNWSPALTVEKLLLSIRSLLADPNPESPMNCAVADMYKNNRKQHDALAREWTARYAKPSASPSSYT